MPGIRGRFGVIFLTVLIDLIGFGIVLPILPFYARAFGVEGLGLGILMSAFSVLQLVATAFLGRLSDRVGRRPILLITMLINTAGYLLFAFAGSYAALLAARVISGFAGGNISVAQAYIADITTPAERSRGMGMIGAAFGLGFTIGPGLGGLSAHYGGSAAPGLVAAGLSLVNFALAWAVLAESLDPAHRRHSALLDLGHVGEAFARRRLRPLLVMWALIPLAFSGYTAAVQLWVTQRLGWQEKDLGYFFVVVGVTAAVVQGYLFGKLVRRTGERRLALWGAYGMAISVAVVPWLSSGAALYAWTFVLAFANSLAAPALTGLVSLYAGPAEQGSILGAAQAVSAMGRSAGPALFGWFYDVSSPSAAFGAAGGVMLAAALVGVALEAVPLTHGPARDSPGAPAT
jgi:predicted MFS family arabinose efflux permease